MDASSVGFVGWLEVCVCGVLGSWGGAVQGHWVGGGLWVDEHWLVGCLKVKSGVTPVTRGS